MLSPRHPWTAGVLAMTGVAAIAWLAGLSIWHVLAIGLAALATGVAVATVLARRVKGPPPASRVPWLEGSFDPNEVIYQDTTSGRIWRLGDVHFLGAAEKRRLAAERPQVWTAYHARLLALPKAPTP
jgi:hypothetical protein